MSKRLKLKMPRVRIPEDVWKRLMAYIVSCPSEVGGIGSVEERDGELIVTDVFLIEQKASADDFEIDPDGLGAFVNEWISGGRNVAELKFWWHSHATMDTFWSAVDDDTMRRLAGESFVISFVGNHRREHRTCLTIMQPMKIVIDDIHIEIIESLDEHLLESAREEIAQKVKKKRGLFSRFGLDGPADRRDFVNVDVMMENTNPFATGRG